MVFETISYKCRAQVPMGLLPVRGPALDLTRAYPKHIERDAEDVG